MCGTNIPVQMQRESFLFFKNKCIGTPFEFLSAIRVYICTHDSFDSKKFFWDIDNFICLVFRQINKTIRTQHCI